MAFLIYTNSFPPEFQEPLKEQLLIAEKTKEYDYSQFSSLIPWHERRVMTASVTTGYSDCRRGKWFWVPTEPTLEIA